MDNGILLGYRSEPYQSLVPLYMLKLSSISLTDSSRAVQRLLIVFFLFHVCLLYVVFSWRYMLKTWPLSLTVGMCACGCVGEGAIMTVLPSKHVP